MTPIKGSGVFRESGALARYRGMRNIIVGIEPGDILTFRLKGTRKKYSIGISHAYHMAGVLEGERLRRERAAKRKARKAGRT